MGEVVISAGIAVMALGIVLFILQARRMSRQAKEDAAREPAVMDKQLETTAPPGMSGGMDSFELGETTGYKK